jgi:hypothetical protein
MAWLDCLAPSAPEKPATTVNSDVECSAMAFCGCDYHYKTSNLLKYPTTKIY